MLRITETPLPKTAVQLLLECAKPHGGGLIQSQSVPGKQKTTIMERNNNPEDMRVLLSY